MSGERRLRYAAYDGSRDDLEQDPNELLSALSDDVLYHGDLAAALRSLLREGFDRRSGSRVEGLRELAERLARRRAELASRLDPSGFTESLSEELDEIVAIERRALDELASHAGATDENEAGRAATGHAELDLLPSDPGGRLEGLQGYSFVSDEARDRLERLIERLRSQLGQLYLDRAGQLAGASPEQRQHLRDGLDALNRLLEQRAAGEELDPSFEDFMANYGDLVPGVPSDLDELVAEFGQRVAAASALVSTMSAEQRSELEALMAGMLGDLDLAFQIDRLQSNLRSELPELSWDAPGDAEGGLPVDWEHAPNALGEVAELARLEQLLRAINDPRSLAELDFDEVERLLGPEARRSLETLSRLAAELEAAGLVDHRDGRLVLSPRGLRRLGQAALEELFSKLAADRFGEHAVSLVGAGVDRVEETKPYEFGDPFRLDLRETFRNATVRLASEEATDHLRFPLRLSPDDFAIEQTEQLTEVSTVLAIDLSLSMPMRDNFLAAKRVAVALQALIAQRYPRDYLGLVGFSATAREIRPAELPEMSWDFAYGTNIQHALRVARRLLQHKSGTKQVILITDGEPTAHVAESGEVFFNYPPVAETLEATFREVARCTAEKIVVNTFVLDATSALRGFVEQLTRRNRGRAFFTTPDRLGDYVLVDFVEDRRRRVKRLRRGA